MVSPPEEKAGKPVGAVAQNVGFGPKKSPKNGVSRTSRWKALVVKLYGISCTLATILISLNY